MAHTTASANGGNYRIEVTDFGPIASAAVDLRPLTVFAGPSNTGKSYLAMLVYALHRCFGSSYRSRLRLPRSGWWFANAMVESLSRREELAARLSAWLSAEGVSRSSPLPDDLAATLRPALEQAAGADEHLAREVRRCFGVDALDDLVRHGRARCDVSIELHGSTVRIEEHARYRFRFGQGHRQFSGKVPTMPALTDGLQDNEYSSRMIDADDDHYLLHSVLDVMFRAVLDPLNRTAYYLPADRTGVMHSHQVVVSTLIQSAASAGLRPSTNVPMLSGVLADFLDDLIGMSQRRRTPYDRARTLEKNLFPGSIRLKRSETGYPSFSYRPADWDTDIPLMRTSSMVSELAPVVLYLRYLVRPGDLLIIEEPESHLHPAMQTAFAAELARLARSGVRVMLTTHSEWMLEALANLVRMGDLPIRERGGITGSELAFSSGDVGAWMFTPNAEGTGSTVEEIPLDTEAGTFPAGYGEITESLYNDWAKISNRIAATQTGIG